MPIPARGLQAVRPSQATGKHASVTTSRPSRSGESTWTLSSAKTTRSLKDSGKEHVETRIHSRRASRAEKRLRRVGRSRPRHHGNAGVAQGRTPHAGPAGETGRTVETRPHPRALQETHRPRPTVRRQGNSRSARPEPENRRQHSQPNSARKDYYRHSTSTHHAAKHGKQPQPERRKKP